MPPIDNDPSPLNPTPYGPGNEHPDNYDRHLTTPLYEDAAQDNFGNRVEWEDYWRQKGRETLPGEVLGNYGPRMLFINSDDRGTYDTAPTKKRKLNEDFTAIMGGTRRYKKGRLTRRVRVNSRMVKNNGRKPQRKRVVRRRTPSRARRPRRVAPSRVPKGARRVSFGKALGKRQGLRARGNSLVRGSSFGNGGFGTLGRGQRAGPVASVEYTAAGTLTTTSNVKNYVTYAEGYYSELWATANLGYTAGTDTTDMATGLFMAPPLTGFDALGNAVLVNTPLNTNERFKYSRRGHIDIANATSVRMYVTIERWVCQDDSDTSLVDRLDDLYAAQAYFKYDAVSAPASVQDHIHFDGMKVPGISKFWKRTRSTSYVIAPNESVRYMRTPVNKIIQWDKHFGKKDGGGTYVYQKGHSIDHRVYCRGPILTDLSSGVGAYSFGKVSTVTGYVTTGCRIGVAGSPVPKQYNLTLGTALTEAQTDIYGVVNAPVTGSTLSSLLVKVLA